MANSKNNEPIYATARQVETFLYSRNGKLTSRDYDKLMRMKLIKSSVRDAIWELKQYSVETLAHCFDVSHLGRGKRIYVRYDSEDDGWYHFSVAYIPRALNNRDVNDVVMKMYFIGRWRVMKKSLLADYEGSDFYEYDPKKII